METSPPSNLDCRPRHWSSSKYPLNPPNNLCAVPQSRHKPLSDPDVVYVGIAEQRTNYLADLRGIWMTTNAWADNPNWMEVTFPFEVEFEPDHDISTPRFWYM